MPPLPLYVLAGGRSRRFGSDKARAGFRGKPLLRHVVESLAPVTCRVTVVAARGGAYGDLGLATIADRRPGAGPLAGLETALEHADAAGETWIVLAACDLARPTSEAIRQLAASLESGRHRAALFRTADGFEPFPGLYHVDLLPSVRSELDQGGGAMRAWLGLLGGRLQTVTAPARAAPFADIDTAEALRRAAATADTDG
ncbi:MAG: molybdenum cofactor guanylyltransferase [Planctomycetota bacterium]